MGAQKEDSGFARGVWRVVAVEESVICLEPVARGCMHFSRHPPSLARKCVPCRLPGSTATCQPAGRVGRFALPVAEMTSLLSTTVIPSDHP